MTPCDSDAGVGSEDSSSEHDLGVDGDMKEFSDDDGEACTECFAPLKASDKRYRITRAHYTCGLAKNSAMDVLSRRSPMLKMDFHDIKLTDPSKYATL